LIARGFIFESVKLPDIYSDWRIIAGLVLMILGAGNWITGVTKTAQYNNALAAMAKNGSAQVSSSFEELDPGTDLAVLEPLIAEQRKVSYANAHMDFYHAAVICGRVMFAGGLVMTLIAFLAVIRRDAHRALARSKLPPLHQA
jgi:hypothetical protein